MDKTCQDCQIRFQCQYFLSNNTGSNELEICDSFEG